jgi:predicted permease
VSNLVLLVACFAVGALARRSGKLPADSHRVFNQWIMYVSLPALVLRSVHGVPLERALFVGASTLWVECVVAVVVATVAIRRGASRPVAGALALCAGLGNTAFLGLPLIESLGGHDAMVRATMIDQLGSFLVLSFVAVPFAVTLGGGNVTPGLVFKRLLTFPPMLALAAALLLRPVAFPEAFDGVLKRLAEMLSPLALASIGWQLDLNSLRGQGRRLALGLTWKMVLAPAVIFAVLWAVHGAAGFGLTERVTVAEAAMPPMVTAGVLSSEHGLDASLAAALIAIGVVVGLVTVPAWWALMGALLPA